MSRLTHIDASGQATMVDVSNKEELQEFVDFVFQQVSPSDFEIICQHFSSFKTF